STVSSIGRSNYSPLKRTEEVLNKSSHSPVSGYRSYSPRYQRYSPPQEYTRSSPRVNSVYRTYSPEKDRLIRTYSPYKANIRTYSPCSRHYSPLRNETVYRSRFSPVRRLSPSYYSNSRKTTY